MDASSDTKPAFDRISRAKKVSVGALIAIILLVSAYLLGLLHNRNARMQEVDAYEKRQAILEAQSQSYLRQRDHVQNVGSLLRTQVLVYRALADLDARNFGLANDHLSKARTWAAQVKSDGSIDPLKLKQVVARLQSTNLNVAVNLQQQRAELLQLAADMESLVAVKTNPNG